MDERMRELQRAAHAGDPQARGLYVRGLQRLVGRGQEAGVLSELEQLARGDQELTRWLLSYLRSQSGGWLRALRVQSQAMIESGQWLPWPVWNTSIRSLRAARAERRRDYDLVVQFDQVGASIVAVPAVLIEDLDRDEWLSFSDGPYPVEVLGHVAAEDLEREVEGAPRGERTLIPMWPAVLLGWTESDTYWSSDLVPAQEAYRSGVASSDGIVTGDRVEVDGPPVSEEPDGSWVKDTEGWLIMRRSAERVRHALPPDYVARWGLA
jgi:hypothetical protein